MKPIMILGGGLAGLGAALNSTGVIYEQGSRPGGHTKSKQVHGFFFDEGIHVLHTKNDYVLKLIEESGVAMREFERSAWIYMHGVYTRFPFQANTYGLPWEVVRDCLMGFIENKFSDLAAVHTYDDWMRYMFGEGIAKHFMVPYSTKFWGVHPRELTTEWVGIRHPRPTLDEVIEGALHDQTKGFGVNATFRYPADGGYGSIGEGIAKRVGDDRIRYQKKVTAIDPEARTVEFNHQEVVPYDRVICTIPLPDVVSMIKNAPTEVCAAVAKLKCVSFFVVNIAVDRPNISNKHWIYFPEDDYSFIRLSFPSNQGDTMAPSGTSSIAAEISYSDERPLPLPPEKMVERVINDLKCVGILNEDDRILFTDTSDIRYAYIRYDFHRTAALKIIHTYLKERQIFPCGRYGEWNYFWSDEAILHGKKVAEDVMAME